MVETEGFLYPSPFRHFFEFFCRIKKIFSFLFLN
jgi:hypothetical protein